MQHNEYIQSVKMTTTLGAHTEPLSVVAYAWECGLDVLYFQTVGGWWSKTHYLKVRGASDQLDRFERFVSCWIS